ncbi:MAG: hypothetical protein IIT70_06360 [Clostridia bacterium]|nr:hypothetical protein [Clostridia bacterium]
MTDLIWIITSSVLILAVIAIRQIFGKKHVAVDIYFTGIGLFTIPNENDLEAIISEMTQITA